MRLIDADKFLEDHKEIADCEINHPRYQDTIKELIESAPTVVQQNTCELSKTQTEIVYCDDCIYLDSEEYFGTYCYKHRIYFDEDRKSSEFFCADGELWTYLKNMRNKETK